MDNPFDALHQRLAVLQEGLTVLQSQLNQLTSRLTEERPEWEPIAVAMATRRKARRVLLGLLVEDGEYISGRIRHRRIPTRGGHEGYLLNRADLDRLFPPTKNPAGTPGGVGGRSPQHTPGV